MRHLTLTIAIEVWKSGFKTPNGIDFSPYFVSKLIVQSSQELDEPNWAKPVGFEGCQSQFYGVRALVKKQDASNADNQMHDPRIEDADAKRRLRI